MKIREIKARSILSQSRVFDYALNPYVGCEYGCRYCYARFMKRFTGHKEKWGEFVDVKINAPELLEKEIKRKTIGRVWISGVCDPYQPIENKYRLTRRCLEILVENNWPLTVQTKSPLVVRDIDILKKSSTLEVCLTITTADERIRKIFEPRAPSIKERLRALSILHSEGIKTHAMIAPLLPGAEKLANALKDRVDYVLIDRMNYHHADWVYRKYRLQWAMKNEFFIKKAKELEKAFKKISISCEVLF
jgi:DNA repair photolyase